MNVIGRDNNVKKAFLAYPEFTEGLWAAWTTRSSPRPSPTRC